MKLEKSTKLGYQLPEEWSGYAVIQHGYAVLGTGDDQDTAIEDAMLNMGCKDATELDLVEHHRNDGDTTIEFIDSECD
jgi:hypothetical protein